jgi:CRP-like cAMP-binding protein
MNIETIDRVLEQHPVFTGLQPDYFELIAGCGRNVAFDAGVYLGREGEQADEFFIVRRGKVAVEVNVPDRGPLVIDTAGPNDVVGFSWLFPPYRWRFDARAIEPAGVVALDGACLRGKCQEDPRLGYELVMRFADVLLSRLDAARLRLVDLYGSGHGR